MGERGEERAKMERGKPKMIRDDDEEDEHER